MGGSLLYFKVVIFIGTPLNIYKTRIKKLKIPKFGNDKSILKGTVRGLKIFREGLEQQDELFVYFIIFHEN